MNLALRPLVRHFILLGAAAALSAGCGADEGADLSVAPDTDLEDRGVSMSESPEDTGGKADLASDVTLRAACILSRQMPASIRDYLKLSDAATIEWQLSGSGPLESGSKTTILDIVGKQHLRYQSGRPYGINLGWNVAQPNPANITFVTSEGGAIRYGQDVAIKVEGGRFLVNKSRDSGINLDWSTTPVYEFRLEGGDGVVQRGQTVRILNTSTVAKPDHDSVVYCQREYGVNLAWSKDCKNMSLVPGWAPSWMKKYLNVGRVRCP